MRRFVLIALCLTMAVLCNTACVGVAFDTIVNDNVSPTFAAFAWDGVPSHPDSMTVISTRTEKELHYCFGYKYENASSAGISDTVSFVRGEYYSVAVGYEEDMYSIPGLGSFLSDRSYPLSGLVARPRQVLDDAAGELSVMEVQSLIWESMGFPAGLLSALDRHDSYWDDMASETPAIESCGPLFVAENKSYIDPTEKTLLSFSPADITVQIDLSIPVVVKQGLNADIECAFACLSGIPSYVTLMSQLMERKDLGKTYIPLSPDMSGKYVGTLRTLGLFSPDLPTFVGGPGILYLYFLTSRDENGEKIYHISQPIVRNLWSALGSSYTSSENKIMSRSSMSNQYYLNVSSYAINLPVITISNIVEGDVKFEWEDGEEFEGSEPDKPEFN